MDNEKNFDNGLNEKTDNAKEEKLDVKKEVISWITLIAVAIGISFILTHFIIINANVPSGSMEKTIMTGDRMVGNRLAYLFSDPQRGEVVIFKNPDNEKEEFVKRIIGTPGDKVVIKNAKIYINDSKEPLDEPYLPEEWVNGNGTDEGELVFKVPKDCYFMLGDNRNSSNDGRFWTNKYVNKKKIEAKAEFVYWPWNSKKTIKSAKYK